MLEGLGCSRSAARSGAETAQARLSGILHRILSVVVGDEEIRGVPCLSHRITWITDDASFSYTLMNCNIMAETNTIQTDRMYERSVVLSCYVLQSERHTDFQGEEKRGCSTGRYRTFIMF